MKKTIIALTLTALAFGSAVPAMAGSLTKAGAKVTAKDVPCKPAKKGYVMIGGKCVKKPMTKTQ